MAQQIDPTHPRTLSTFVPLSRKAASMVAVIVRPLFGGILHVVRRHGGDCKKMRRQKAVVCASTGAMAGWLAGLLALFFKHAMRRKKHTP